MRRLRLITVAALVLFSAIARAQAPAPAPTPIVPPAPVPAPVVEPPPVSPVLPEPPAAIEPAPPAPVAPEGSRSLDATDADAQPTTPAAEPLPVQKVKSAMPGALVSLGQCFAFGATQWGCGMMSYALFAIPFIAVLTGPLGVLASCLFVPGLGAISSVIVGDYLSGDRHPLLIALAASYGTIWGIALVTLLVNVALGGLATILSVALYNTATEYVRNVQRRPGGLGSTTQQDISGLVGIFEAGAPGPLALVAVLGVVDFLAFWALAIAPPVVTTIAMSVLRKDQAEDSKLPRLVRHDEPKTGRSVVLGSRR